jgi:H+/gluconate symporter-like permease
MSNGLSVVLVILIISSIVMLITGAVLRSYWRISKESYSKASSEDKKIQLFSEFLNLNEIVIPIIVLFLVSVLFTLLSIWLFIREIIGRVFGHWI